MLFLYQLLYFKSTQDKYKKGTSTYNQLQLWAKVYFYLVASIKKKQLSEIIFYFDQHIILIYLMFLTGVHKSFLLIIFNWLNKIAKALAQIVFYP
jgi:hypothetical protein